MKTPGYPEPTPLSRVLSYFPDARRSGAEWVVACPSHADNRPSLSIREGDDGRVLLVCRSAGCSAKSICNAIGIEMKDLFPQEPFTAHRGNGHATSGHSRANGHAKLNGDAKPAKTFSTAAEAVADLERFMGKADLRWIYRDAEGQPVCVICRWNRAGGKKDIRPVSRRPDGRWGHCGMDSPRPLYQLPNVIAADVVVVCEGEKAADAAASLGFTATTSAHGSESPDKTDWGPLGEKRVLILPDNDQAGEKYAAAVVRLLQRLPTPPTVRVVRLPDLPPKGDAFDFVELRKTQGVDAEAMRREVEDLAAKVEPEKAPAKQEGPAAVNEAIDDPDRLARLLVRRKYITSVGDPTLRYHRAEWFVWNGDVYREVDEDEIRAAIHDLAKEEFDAANLTALEAWSGEGKRPIVAQIRQALETNVIGALKAKSILPGSVVMPQWIKDDPKLPRPSDLLAVENGLLFIGDFLREGDDPRLLPHSPNWFSRTRFPYPWKADADCPAWKAFLDRNLEADQARIDLLGEWFGYCLTHDTSRQKFILFEGEGANGKSIVCAVQGTLLGRENCSSVPLEVFGERFQLTNTLGKLANIVSEVGELDRMAEGFLKAFTSGDEMSFDRKHRDPISATPTARLILASNNRPRFSDRSGGLWRRMILFPMRVVIPESERRLGMDKGEWWLEQGELPGILNWALDGLRRLRLRGEFTRSDVCEEAAAEYRVENNPARKFLLDACVEDPVRTVGCSNLYAKYKAWCEEHGNKPLADGPFGKEVTRAFPRAARARPRTDIGRVTVYEGIAMKEW